MFLLSGLRRTPDPCQPIVLNKFVGYDKACPKGYYKGDKKGSLRCLGKKLELKQAFQHKALVSGLIVSGWGRRAFSGSWIAAEFHAI